MKVLASVSSPTVEPASGTASFSSARLDTLATSPSEALDLYSGAFTGNSLEPGANSSFSKLDFDSWRCGEEKEKARMGHSDETRSASDH